MKGLTYWLNNYLLKYFQILIDIIYKMSVCLYLNIHDRENV